MEPPTLGAAMLCSSWASTDMWLYPELITIVHRDGVTTRCVDSIGKLCGVSMVFSHVYTKQYAVYIVRHLALPRRDSNSGPRPRSERNKWRSRPLGNGTRINFKIAVRWFILFTHLQTRTTFTKHNTTVLVHMFDKITHKKFPGYLLYILTSIWVLCTPNAVTDLNLH